ncbi:MAG: Flp pilus assembly protein TadD [Paraglaciecola psychrophila]
MAGYRLRENAVSKGIQMIHNSITKRQLSAVILLTLAGCAPVPTIDQRPLLSAEILLQGAPLLPAQSTSIPAHVPANIPASELVSQGASATVSTPVLVPEDLQLLQLSPAMLDFLEQHVGRPNNPERALRLLLLAIVERGDFKLEYDTTTGTAAETFANGRGNCLSFTNMFIAFARELGLDARYQQVDIPPYWGRQGDSFIFNLHVNVSLILKGEEQVIDFNMVNFRPNYRRRVISDVQAKAHFYNNIAVEEMLAGNPLQAFRRFRSGLALAPSSAPLWSNLGNLYQRGGHFEHARSSYFQALSQNRNHYVAMTNLQKLYLSRGEDQRAQFYGQQVASHRQQNPYYRFELGKEALAKQDYPAAIAHLRYAISRKQQEDRFYFLLGEVYLQQGDLDRASFYWQKAVDIAPDAQLKGDYRSRIVGLLGPGLG